MTSNTEDHEAQGMDRRDFLRVGAAGIAAAGAAAAGLATTAASAKTIVPGEPLKTNATKGGKRVIIINDALLQIGPPLARNFAKKGYNLVIAQPAEGLVKECEGHGAKVIVVPGIEQHGPNDERRPDSTQKLVDAAMKEFGGFDSAYIRTAQHMPGDIFKINAKDMQLLYEGNFLAVVYSLQSLLPPLMEKGAGQILILTSASSEQALSDFAGYSLIARGVAKLFGYEVVHNFEQPYFARSFSEFWRRWHISLSTWIWDYLFNPLTSFFLRRIGRLELPDVKQEMRLAYPAAAMSTMLLQWMDR